ncbi:hypothetical protein [Micromonospora sp. NPDC049891]|uniref:hypothetical protein n=1 Tax=Micromonospora sp. NPDC049891 TaxID=3155655 RepID=UPI0033C514B8
MDQSNGLVFRTSARLMFLFLLLVGLLAWALVRAVLTLFLGKPTDLAVSVGSGVLYAVLFSGFSLLLNRGNWSAVEVTDSALRLTERQRTALLPWQMIESATVHRPGPFAVLQVTLLPAVVAPTTTLRARLRAGKPVYTVNVGMLRPATDVLRAELARRLPPGGSSAHDPAR